MATPTDSKTAEQPQDSLSGPAGATETDTSAPTDSEFAEGAAEAPDGSRVLPDGVQVSGQTDSQDKTLTQSADSPSPQAESDSPREDKRPEVGDLPDWAQKLIKDARSDAAKARTTAKQEAATEAAAAATKKVTEDIGRALGLITDDTPEEEKLTPEQLQELLSGERSSTHAARTELAVFKAAQGGSFNAAALLDSKSFLDSLKGIDPGNAEAVAEKIVAALDSNPWLKGNQTSSSPKANSEASPAPTAPAVPAVPAAPSGGSFAGGPGARSQDLTSMSIDDFREMRRNNSSRG